MTSVKMSNVGLWSLAVHTICKERSKEPRHYAVSQDQHEALTLIQRALGKKQPITLYFSSGTGLISEGAAGYTFAMQRLQQVKMSILSIPLSTNAHRENINQASQVRKVTKRLIATKGIVPAKN